MDGWMNGGRVCYLIQAGLFTGERENEGQTMFFLQTDLLLVYEVFQGLCHIVKQLQTEKESKRGRESFTGSLVSSFHSFCSFSSVPLILSRCEALLGLGRSPPPSPPLPS